MGAKEPGMQTEQVTMDEILSGNQSEAEPAEPAPQETEAVESATGDAGEQDSGSPPQAKAEAQEQDQGGDEVWQDPPEGEHIPRHVYVATRKKMREKVEQSEREAAELRGQLEAYARSQRQASQDVQQQQPSEEDQRQALENAYWNNPVEFTAKLVQNALGQSGQIANRRVLMLSEALAKQRHADFDASYASFQEAMELNPALKMQCLQADDPGEFAYQNGKLFAEAKKFDGDIDKIRAEAKREAIEEMRKSGAIQAAKNASTSSAGARGSGANTADIDAGEMSMSDILAG